MKKAFLASVLGLVLTAAPAQAQTGHMMMDGGRQHTAPGQVRQQSGQQYGPGMMGGGMGMMGPGMMGGGMGMMGPGMMGGGMGMGPGMMGGGMGMGPGMMGGGMGMMMDPAAIEKQDRFLTETVKLRKQIHDKQFEYFEATRNPKATRESLLKKEQELYGLRQKLNDKAQEFWKQ